jgi:multidrug efflux pump subunit AcrA (membrane-fusion protein)
VRYPAELTRFRGTIDDETGTVGLAVRVDDPLLVNTAAQRPPLEIGSFVSVHLESAPTQNAITVPRAVVRQSDAGDPFVYTATAEDQLAIATVDVGPVIGDRIVIQQGLQSGDRIILSAPRPPIEGLPLTLVPSEGASE